MRVCRVCTEFANRICQGDIFRDVEYFEGMTEADGNIEIRKILFPLAIVLTQDCDLHEDHRLRSEDSQTQDKCLISVLMAPLYNAQHVFAGEHLMDPSIMIKSSLIPNKRTAGDFLMKNQRPRYHYLEFPETAVSLTSSIIDFKHYFSCPVSYLEKLEKNKFVCKIQELDREDISQRFAAFLSRIGLP